MIVPSGSADAEASSVQVSPTQEDVNDAVGAWFVGGFPRKRALPFQLRPPLLGPLTKVAEPDVVVPVQAIENRSPVLRLT